MAEKFNSVEEAVHYMNNAYDRHGNYMVDGRPQYTAHAVRMEDTYGLTGIAGRYKFVEGKEAAFAEYDYRKEFQRYFIADKYIKSDDPICRQAGETLKDKLPQALADINGEIGKLTELNPELGRLNYNKNSIAEAYRALTGITSQYNPDDINAYLHKFRTGGQKNEVSERVEALQKKGIRFGWQPAMATVEKIEAQLKAKEKQTVVTAVLNKAKSR